MKCNELAEILMKVYEQRPNLEVTFSTGDREHTRWVVDSRGMKYATDPDYHTDLTNNQFSICLSDIKYQQES